jgi:hypothetical protein
VAVYRLNPPQIIPSAKIRRKNSPLEFFLDQDGILLIEYLQKCQTTNADYYSSLLVQLKEKRRGKFNNGVLFLQHNAQAHRALATQKKLAYLGFQCFEHTPHPPDLAPSEYHPFSELTKTIENHHVLSKAEINSPAETWLDRHHSEFF